MKDQYQIALNKNERALARIYFIPHAGGNYSQYLAYKNLIDSAQIEPYILELPGRGANFKEQNSINSWNDFIERSFEIIQNQDKPAIFFGHSFGSLVAYELVKRLERANNPHKTKLITSACFAPTDENFKKLKRISQADDKTLWEEVKKFGAITDDLIQNTDLSSFFLKGIRFDFHLFENYQSIDNHPIRSSIESFLGLDDQIYAINQMEEWKNFTTSNFKMKIFNGDHFYLLKDPKNTATYLNKIIANFLQKEI